MLIDVIISSLSKTALRVADVLLFIIRFLEMKLIPFYLIFKACI